MHLLHLVAVLNTEDLRDWHEKIHILEILLAKMLVNVTEWKMLTVLTTDHIKCLNS